MSKVLVAYFSVGGTTAKAARELAAVEKADLFEIRPEIPYVPADLDYTNKQSRTTLEMTDPSCRPAIAGKVADMAQYDVVFIGFPIWWGREPSVVDTFLDAYCFIGKKVIPFCTSGGNDTAAAAKRIRELLGEGVCVDDGRRLGGEISEEDLKLWAEGML
ncbi:MAG: NAD(P)H-dependent oxidoreductase [Oscillospiraceae bacterium]|nr:NAD(P)H-dependent oxidoreductase [Oscillospiraceae bacterium]MBP5240057.1 NAD(P)H-dependent oxidoreductase [Oscillospiraceae bacterium]